MAAATRSSTRMHAWRHTNWIACSPSFKKHIADAVQVGDLASTVHMSPYHFARAFKQTVGQPPHAYITGQRMERAKDLLRNTDLPLVDVAASAGFQTQAHFTGVFRKHAGVTPRIFRLNGWAGHLAMRVHDRKTPPATRT